MTAAFDTGEIAIDTVAMAMSIRRRIAEDPGIDVRTSRKITAVEDDGARLRVHSTGVDSGDSDGNRSVASSMRYGMAD